MLDIVSKGLYQEDVSVSKEDIQNEEVVSENEVEVEKKNIVTTQEELDGFEAIKNILQENNKDISEVNYKDTTNYFSVYLKNTTKWIVRFNFDASKKNIITKLSVETAKEYCPSFEVEQSPKSVGESRIFITSIENLKDLEQLIIEAYNFVK